MKTYMNVILFYDVWPQRSLKVTKYHFYLRHIFCVSNLILPKFGMNANIIDKDSKFYLIITLFYVLLNNFCPCFSNRWNQKVILQIMIYHSHKHKLYIPIIIIVISSVKEPVPFFHRFPPPSKKGLAPGPCESFL